jgi:tetratricopeptide (TPR) repeat protein
VHPIAAIDSVVDFALIRAVIILGAVVAAAAVARKRGEPLATFGIIWLLVALLPGLALILLADRGQPMAERRLYLASCGFFIAVAAVVSHISHVQAGRLSARLVTTSAVVVALAASLLASTVARNRVWADPVLLWTDATEKAPATWLAHFGLAQAYQEVGDCEAAVPAYERAIALVPGNVEAYLGLTACLAELQRPAEARRVLRQAIVQVPQTTDARLSLAQLEEQAHNPAEALRLCRETLALAPATPEPERCVERNERALSGR